jgi:hypothetical protein
MIRHLKFIRDHHEQVSRVALVTDSSALGQFATRVSSHFVKAEIQSFPYPELSRAVAWIAGDRDG